VSGSPVLLESVRDAQTPMSTDILSNGGDGMAYDSRVFRIVIASPSDVEEEREDAVRVIQSWNDLHSYSRKVTLLALRWETHTAPEYGARPQEVVNRAIIDECDMLVGIFWTRIGTPTGSAASGTIEEIERVGTAHKPVMLYFSRVGADPEQIDSGQIERLKKFKLQTYPNGLVESYKSRTEFRDKFARQLELKVRDLQRREACAPLPLSFGFLDKSNSLEGKRFESLELPRVADFSHVPQERGERRSAVESLVAQCIHARTFVPIPLVLANTSSSGLRHLYVELSISASCPDAEVTDFTNPTDNFLWRCRSAAEHFRLVSGGPPDPLNLQLAQFEVNELCAVASGWRLAFEWEALQSQRRRVINPVLYVKARRSTEFSLAAKVFSDTHPEPFILHATLSLQVTEVDVELGHLLPNWATILEEETERRSGGSR